MAKVDSITLEIAFGDPPSIAPSLATWEDVSDRVRNWEISRGRQDIFQDIEPGKATFFLDNSDRRFDNIASPDAVPNLRIRFKATFLTVDYPLFSGFIDSHPPEYPGFFDAVVALRCTDIIKPLAFPKLFDTFTQETASDRIESILDAAQWPSGAEFRDIDSSSLIVQGVELAGSSPLEHLKHVNQSVFGRFFGDREGRAKYIDRLSLILSPPAVSATFGDGGGAELGYKDIKLSFGEETIFNRVQFTNIGGTQQVAENSSSQAAYFLRDFSNRTNMLLTNDSEAFQAAHFILQEFEEPRIRIDELTFSGNRSNSHLIQLLAREIGDKVQVIRRPDAGTPIDKELIIEGIKMTGVPNKIMECTWLLSQAETEDFWILEDSIKGVLDVTTRLAF